MSNNEESKLQQIVSESPQEPAINQLALKLPTYFDDITLWISQVEAAYNGSRPKISTEKVKYYLLISSLPGHVLSVVADKMRPDEDQPYTVIKEALLERLSAPNPDILRSLKNVTLNGRRPYSVLTDIRSYCTRLNIQSEDFQKELLIEAMPNHIKLVLLPLKSTISLDNLAHTADSLLSSIKTELPTQSVHRDEVSNSSTAISNLRQEMIEMTDKLSEQINALNIRGRIRDNREGQLCYYHKRFGKNAYKCEMPCSWHPKPRNSGPYRKQQYQGNF